MHTAIKFVDISIEPNEVLPSIEGTIMKLPQDFLYPFFISHSVYLQCDAMLMFLLIIMFMAC